MKIDLFKILNDKKLLVLISLLFTYGFWSIIKNSQTGKIIITVPVSIYNNIQNKIISFPKTFTLSLYGPRAALISINKTALAIFIDAEKLLPGTQKITVDKNHLLLPSTIELEKKQIPTLTITTESTSS